MARQARRVSNTGIFHVMMRGINHQNSFEESEDYYQFTATLDRLRVNYDEEGTPLECNYAYCLMFNHFERLIGYRTRTNTESMMSLFCFS